MSNHVNSAPSPSSLVSGWVQQYADSLYQTALYKTHQTEIAEDLVQETFLAALQNIEKYEGKASPKTWLSSILKNKIADFFREHYRNKQYISNENITDESLSFDHYFDENGRWKPHKSPTVWNDSDKALDQMAFQQVMHTCIAKLPTKWQGILKDKYLEDAASDSICEENAISKSNFWQIMHRAKLRLRCCLEQLWFKS